MGQSGRYLGVRAEPHSHWCVGAGGLVGLWAEGGCHLGVVELVRDAGAARQPDPL